MIAVEKRGDAVAASAAGDPPALLTSDVEAPEALDGGVDHRVDCVGLAHVGGDERRARSPARGSCSGSCRPQTTTSAPASRKRSAMPRPTPSAAAGDEHDPPGQVERRQRHDRRELRTVHAVEPDARQIRSRGPTEWAITAHGHATASPRSSWTTRRSTR